jgi:hypothetical protein
MKWENLKHHEIFIFTLYDQCGDNYPSNTVCFIRNEISFRILFTFVYYKLRRLQTVSQFSLHFFPDFFWMFVKKRIDG